MFVSEITIWEQRKEVTVLFNRIRTQIWQENGVISVHLQRYNFELVIETLPLTCCEGFLSVTSRRGEKTKLVHGAGWWCDAAVLRWGVCPVPGPAPAGGRAVLSVIL